MPLQDLSGDLKLRQAWPRIEQNDQYLEGKIDSHTSDTNNPHGVTAAQVGAETPAGAQAKADVVQSNLNIHMSDLLAHLSPEDRAKFESIEEGAEVNQFAFATIGTILATSPTDTITFESGTGISITYNPTLKKITWTATGDATPGPHGPSHDPDGSDPIPALSALIDAFNALTAADIGAETPAGAQAKVDALAGVGNTKTVKQIDDEVTAHLADYIRQPAFATTSGTSTAYTVTLDPAPTSLIEGFGITIVPHVDCGASPTLNINGLGAVALKDQKGIAITAGKMVAGKPYTFRLVGTDFLADSGSEGGGGSSLHDWSAYTTHQNWAGTSTAIPAASFATMLDVTGDGQLVFVRADTSSAGSARNPDIRMTVDGTAYTFEGVDAGANRQGNMLLEPIYFKSSLKIEVFNRSASAGSFWLDYTYLLKTGTPGESQTLLTSSARKMAYSEVFAATDSDVVNITGSGYLLGIDFSAYYNSGVANLLGTVILDGTTIMNGRILFSPYASSGKISTFKGPLRFDSNLIVRHRMSTNNVSTAVTRVWYTLD
ncbi:hypothetical protein D3C76_180070 [compost metagenome]